MDSRSFGQGAQAESGLGRIAESGEGDESRVSAFGGSRLTRLPIWVRPAYMGRGRGFWLECEQGLIRDAEIAAGRSRV
jgi:hypothetical protein